MVGSIPKVLCVAGARPNFMKIAPLLSVFQQANLNARLVHTGQHYDMAMNEYFFEQLGIPVPDFNLNVGSGSHAKQTAEIMLRFEPILEREQPAALIVVGDVNSTIACALVAAKLGVPVAHVEAGLRSYDRTMPEEINRLLTDQIAEWLFTTEQEAKNNLIREGIAEEKIHFVGNVMIDTLFRQRPRAVPAEVTLAAAGATSFIQSTQGYGVVTLHRSSNVDDPIVLRRVLIGLMRVSDKLPLVFPLHPRTLARMQATNLDTMIGNAHICCLPPQAYLQMLGLIIKARLVLTDSGGLQEETTALGIPCITLRDNTERPITVSQGTNTLVGTDSCRIEHAVTEILLTGGKAGRIPQFWDGCTAERITAVLKRDLMGNASAVSYGAGLS